VSEFFLFLRMLPEIRKLLIAVGQLIEAGRTEDAASVVLSYRLGTAAGRAAYEASRTAGRPRP